MCEEYELLISRMLDHDLTPEEEADLLAHMSSCPSCQAAYEALSVVSSALSEEPAVPPAELAADVMDRIMRYRSVPRRLPFIKILIAACLVLVIGIGGQRLWRSSRSVYEDADEMAAAGSVVAEEYGALPEAEEYAGAPMAALPMPEPNPETDRDAGDTQAAAGAADVPQDDELPHRLQALYPIDSPAAVPEGLEADFEALLTDARIEPPNNASVLCYVEYRGVIYEFSADGETLVWRDAAEGMPTVSLSPASALFALLL